MVAVIIQFWFFVSIFIFFMVALNLMRHSFLAHKIISQKSFLKPNEGTGISIIIPVRNEKQHICSCLDAVRGVQGEIILINDGSTDSTLAEIKRFMHNYGGVSVQVHSVKKPKGWIGKNYACAMGVKYAKYDTYCFIDADVRANGLFLNKCAFFMHQKKIGFFSIFPQQHSGNIWSHFYASMLNWFLLGFYPSFFQWLGFSFLKIANGQCIFMTKKTYGTVNHSLVKNSQIEDMDLAKLAAQQSIKRDVLYTDMLTCQMYETATDSINGFSRNFRRVTGLHSILFLIWLNLYTLFFILPLILMFFDKIYLVLVLIFVLTWSMVMQTSDKPFAGILYPVYVSAVYICGVVALQKEKRGDIQWKGRKL